MKRAVVSEGAGWFKIKGIFMPNETARVYKCNETDFSLSHFFRDGTILVALVEKLQKRKLRGHNKKPNNQHHEIENITIALDAIKEDGIKLVNIGKKRSENIYAIEFISSGNHRNISVPFNQNQTEENWIVYRSVTKRSLLYDEARV